MGNDKLNNKARKNKARQLPKATSNKRLGMQG